jgi:hypothetical protein
MYICVFPDSTLAVISVRTGFMDAVWIFPRKMRTPWTSTCVMNVCRNKRRSKKRNCTVYVDNLTTKPSMCTVLGQKKKCGFPFSRPYLAFGRRNPDPKLFYWIMLVSVST